MFPAGRLDKDTTGFVLITNDGEFAHRILSPKKHISKTYLARLARPVDGRSIEAFRSGLVLADGTRCMEAGLQILEDDETPLAEVVLHEGRYHQIKRMFAALGNEVIALRRVKMGDLPLDETLGPGGCRKITAEELQKIIQAVNGLSLIHIYFDYLTLFSTIQYYYYIILPFILYKGIRMNH